MTRIPRKLAYTLYAGAILVLTGCVSTVPDQIPFLDIEPSSENARIIDATYERLFFERYRLSLSEAERLASVRSEAQNLFMRFCAETPIVHQQQEVLGTQGLADVQVYRYYMQMECEFDGEGALESRRSGSLGSYIVTGSFNTPQTESGEYFGFFYHDERGSMKLEIATRGEDHSFWNIDPEKRYMAVDMVGDPPPLGTVQD